MRVVKVKAYAKINITLEVLGQSDGFHLLDSFVASVDVFDRIIIRRRKDKQVTVRMRGMDSEQIPEDANNATKAARAFMRRYGTDGADIVVDKNIPMGAGLGGSSADAAGVLNGMAQLYGIDDEQGLDELADALGSDTRYMRHGGFARMQGRGQRCYYLPTTQTPLFLLLVCPRTSVSTKRCFEIFDETGENGATGATAQAVESYIAGDVAGIGRAMYNALYPAATTLNGEIGEWLERLKGLSPLGATMTGAGSCVTALFESRELCLWAKEKMRDAALCMVVKTV